MSNQFMNAEEVAGATGMSKGSVRPGLTCRPAG